MFQETSLLPLCICSDAVKVSYRALMGVALEMVRNKILKRCDGRAIVITAAQLMEVGGRNTHDVPIITTVGISDDWRYPIAEIALGKLKISAVTRMSSQEVQEAARLQISGFPYYGSTVLRLHPDYGYWFAIAASGLTSDEDVAVTEDVAVAVQKLFHQLVEFVGQEFPGLPLELEA